MAMATMTTMMEHVFPFLEGVHRGMCVNARKSWIGIVCVAYAAR
jgi:hypothetical protein